MKRTTKNKTRISHGAPKSLAYRYGRALQAHPVRTIINGALVLTLLAGLGLGGYYLLVYRNQVHSWQDRPAADIGKSAPLLDWNSTPFDIYGDTTVKVMQDDTKTKAIQFLAAANQSSNQGGYPNQRAELTPKTADIKPGQIVWVGLDVRINKGLGVAQDFQQILQLKDNTGGSPSFALTSNEHEDGLSIRRSDGPAGTPNYYESIGPTPYDTWTRLVIGLGVTRSADTSTVDVWRDGQPKVLHENWPAFNQAGNGHSGGLLYDDATSGYLKFGIYRAPQSWPMDIRMSNIKIAATREAVQ